MPSLRRRLSDPFSPNNTGDDLYGGENEEILSANPGGVFSPNVQNKPADPAGHYESNRSRSNSPYAPTLLHEGEVIGSGAPPSAAAPNPYAARLADLGGQLQSAYQAPHAGAFRQVLGALLSRKNPALGGIVSGETQRQRKIEPLQEEYGLVTSLAAGDYARQKAIADIRKSGAEANKADVEAGAIPDKQKLERAQAEAANFKEDANLGLVDIRTGKPLNDSALAPLTGPEAQVLGKQQGERVPLKLKNTANEIVNRGFATVNTEEGVYERNRGTSTGTAPTMTRMGSNPRNVFSPENRIIPVAPDPKNPGNIVPMKAGDALREGVTLPGSASVAAAKTEAKSEVPTNIGNKKVAFKTAIAHADLLRKAAKALDNGDVQVLNGLKNDFKNAFGYSGPITAQAIADAYGGEVTDVVSKGHITDKEIEKTGKTLNPLKQNYQTIDSVLSGYQALMQSKMDILQQQADAAKSGGEANAPEAKSDFKPF